MENQNKTIKDLIEYLNKESDNGKNHTEFRLVVGYLPENKSYIHVLNRDSTTLDFELPNNKK